MLTDTFKFLKSHHVLLASGSPRRLELLKSIIGKTAYLSKLPIPESVENMDWRSFKSPEEYVRENVQKKLVYAMEMIKERSLYCKPADLSEEEPSLVLCADTIVVNEQTVLEKPKSVEHNKEMLRMLNGREHRVLTAVCMALTKDAGSDPRTCFVTETKVRFMEMDESTINWYADSLEGSDKAGGYAIQGLGMSLIPSITGDYNNVVGFPVHRFVDELARLLKRNENVE